MIFLKSAINFKIIAVIKRGDKLKLLKVSVAFESDKVSIIRNCTKLCNTNFLTAIQKVFITPDLVPKEQETSPALIILRTLPLNNSDILHLAVINCQSIVAKRFVFHNFLDSHSPKIITGCESRLSSSIVSNEIFPQQYYAYRKDRSDGYGGVFIACHNSLLASKLELQNTSLIEVVACKIQ